MISTGPESRPGAVSVLLTAAAFVVVVAGMRAAQPLIVPFLMAVFVAIVAAPPVFWLERRGLPKILALLAVLAVLAGVSFAISALMGSSIRQFSTQLPVYKSRLSAEAKRLFGWLQERGLPVDQDDIVQYLDPGAAIQLVADVFNGFGGVLTNAFLIFLTVVFILLEAHSLRHKLSAVTDHPERSLERLDAIGHNVNSYLAIKTLASLGTGAAVAICLVLIGVDYPLLWGMLAFLLNYVPNIGSVIAAVPTILFAYIQLGAAAAGWTALAYAAVNGVVGNVVEPRFMGRGLGLSTLVVFVSLVFWGWVLGPVGMFLSVPLTMTAKIALDSHDDTRWIAVLLGADAVEGASAAGAEAASGQGETPASDRA